MVPVLATDSVSADLSRAVGYALLWGLEGVALRTVGGGRVPFVNEAVVRRRLAEDDLPLAAADPGLFEGSAVDRAVWLNDVAAFEDTAAFCRRLRCPTVRVGALGSGGAPGDRVSALRMLGDAAARRGLRVAVRNEAGSAVATGADLAGLLAAVAHPAVAADWHPAEAHAAGEDVLAGIDALLALGPDAVATVAVGDGTWDGTAPADALVGEGALRWAEQLGGLAGSGYAGPLVLSVTGRPVGPAGLASASALVRLARAAVREARGRGGPG